MTIGELAKQSGISAVAIRYYEKCGLIQGVLRTDGGHRIYDNSLITRLHFISNARLAGFSLEEIRALLLLQQNKKQPKAAVKQLVENTIKTIDIKITALKGIKNTLSALVSTCNGKGSTATCAILHSLQQGQLPQKKLKT